MRMMKIQDEEVTFLQSRNDKSHFLGRYVCEDMMAGGHTQIYIYICIYIYIYPTSRLAAVCPTLMYLKSNAYSIPHTPGHAKRNQKKPIFLEEKPMAKVWDPLEFDVIETHRDFQCLEQKTADVIKSMECIGTPWRVRHSHYLIGSPVS